MVQRCAIFAVTLCIAAGVCAPVRLHSSQRLVAARLPLLGAGANRLYAARSVAVAALPATAEALAAQISAVCQPAISGFIEFAGGAIGDAVHDALGQGLVVPVQFLLMLAMMQWVRAEWPSLAGELPESVAEAQARRQRDAERDAAIARMQKFEEKQQGLNAKCIQHMKDAGAQVEDEAE
ncbi:Vacuolar fusion MON1 A [Chlorella sorokiniana]|uniref:Vacuolar fusion MON1 A n=1 Tax=Chlorella sorokiniana TaxID=3076 RepID=A0A2P6TYR6_CHLSO|nr:Vacuolar fusion MON1 A [Chlorella sorokiniana]|eukprot:PRW59204.1 Vacuolar fusion MON1 A [Chlorella sorokiniana]